MCIIKKVDLGRADQVTVIERVIYSQQVKSAQTNESLNSVRGLILKSTALVFLVGISTHWVTLKEHVPRQKFHGYKKLLPYEITGLWVGWRHCADGEIKTFGASVSQLPTNPQTNNTSEPDWDQLITTPQAKKKKKTTQKPKTKNCSRGKAYSISKRRARAPDLKV